MEDQLASLNLEEGPGGREESERQQLQGRRCEGWATDNCYNQQLFVGNQAVLPTALQQVEVRQAEQYFQAVNQEGQSATLNQEEGPGGREEHGRQQLQGGLYEGWATSDSYNQQGQLFVGNQRPHRAVLQTALQQRQQVEARQAEAGQYFQASNQETVSRPDSSYGQMTTQAHQLGEGGLQNFVPSAVDLIQQGSQYYQVPSQRPILFGDYPQQFVANQEASAVLWGQMLAQAPQQQQQVVRDVFMVNGMPQRTVAAHGLLVRLVHRIAKTALEYSSEEGSPFGPLTDGAVAKAILQTAAETVYSSEDQ